MFRSEPCEQCGLRNHHRSGCGARNAECNKCRQIGHFGRVCFRGNRSNRKTEFEILRKKQRDRRRMTEFMARKDAMNLPFYNLAESELAELAFNSSLRSVQKRHAVKNHRTINHLSCVVDEQTEVIDTIRNQCEKLEDQLQTVTAELERVRKEKLRQRAEYHAIRRELARTKDNEESWSRNYQQAKIELEKENEKLKDYKVQTRELTEKFATLQETLIKCETESSAKDGNIASLQEQLEISENDCLELRKEMSRPLSIFWQLQRLQEIESTVTDDQVKGACKKCGSHDRVHPRNRCPAKGSLCGCCHRIGHFTVFCKIGYMGCKRS